MPQDWSDKLKYLHESRFEYHNADYLEFLVWKVWRITKPSIVADFGCGYGYFGTAIMPHLPVGSTYTGIDVSEGLISEGQKVFADLPYEHRFLVGDACDAPFADGEFDIGICHSLLMHLKHPKKAIAEMMRVTRKGGLVIACESNVNAVNALLHVAEIEKSESFDLGFLQRNFERIVELTGNDFNIGAKVPVMLNEAGLVGIEARTTDSIRCSFPPVDSEAKRVRLNAILRDLGEAIDGAKASEMKEMFLNRGFSGEEAADQIERAMVLVNAVREKPELHHIVMPQAMTFSFGRVPI